MQNNVMITGSEVREGGKKGTWKIRRDGSALERESSFLLLSSSKEGQIFSVCEMESIRKLLNIGTRFY